MAHQRLSAQDAMFLDLETATQPMHVGAVARLRGEVLRDRDGRLRMADLRSHLAARMHLVPRFRQRILTSPLGITRPVWVDDPDFDIVRHVHGARVLEPGDASALDETVTRLLGSVLDRSMPLWQIWFLDGLTDGDVGMVLKAHHAMVDGIAGIAVAAALMDLDPTATIATPPAHIPDPSPPVTDVVLDGVADLVTDLAGALRTAADVLRRPETVAAGAEHWGDALSTLTAPAPPMRWNAPLSRRRTYTRSRIPIEGIKRVQRASGVKLNDVVLAACADALGRYLVHLGETVDPDLVLRAVVPASVRSDDEHDQLGNRVAVMIADLPVGEPDVVRRLEATARSVGRAKVEGHATATDQLLGLARFATGSLVTRLGRTALGHRVSNVTITNVPGPDVALYCMGAEVRDVSPYVGLLDNHGLTIALISYRDHLGFGLVGEPELTPDLDVLGHSIEEAVMELVDKLG